MLCGLQGFTKRVPKIVGTFLALLFPAIKPERRERKETAGSSKFLLGVSVSKTRQETTCDRQANKQPQGRMKRGIPQRRFMWLLLDGFTLNVNQ